MANITLNNVASKTTADAHYANTSNPHSVTKSQVGLGNADNTSDADKPVSTAMQTALDLKQSIATLFSSIMALVLTGFAAGANTAVAATDTLAQALAKFQGQINARVVSNASISADTKTKITYDAKGLVTSGTDATTADIADSLNKRYVTDANLTTIGNQSGTNTGDETAARIGAIVNGATAYTTPLDADKVGIWDTLNGLFKAVTWANIKATLKTYFDTLYAPGNHSVICDTGNGFGSTATRIRRFTNVATVGTAITATQSSTNGDLFTINEAGLYSITSQDVYATSFSSAGISKNASSLTNACSTLAASERIALGYEATGGNVVCVTRTVRLAVNDVIRSHAEGAAANNPSTASYVQFSIIKIGL